ncbi:MAG: AEC family transporter [Methyloligellaceae bacterium]
MYDVIAIVAPVFGLIALGYLLAVTGLLSEAAAKGLTDFVFIVAVPALLFRMMATVSAPEVSPIGIWVSYFGASAVVWVAAMALTAFVLKRPARDAASIAMGGAFGNIVMLGIPLALDRFGDAAATPIALIVSISSPLLWFAATLHIEMASQRDGTSWVRMLRELVVSLLRNPIILGVLAGTAWRLTGLGIHPIPDKMITLLSQAAVPTALVALGLSLTAFEIRGQVATTAVICILSVVLMPAVAWVLAAKVFGLPPVWTGVAVLLAACPTGANAFLFASRYNAVTGSVSGAVAIATALSVVTISLMLLVLG